MNPVEENEVSQILAKKLCTQEQVDEAQTIQDQMVEMGLQPRTVPEVLCEKGYLAAADLEAIQHEERFVQGRDQIAGYKILDLVGRGRLGSVYRAKQLSLDRVVALKILNPELAKDTEYAERFMKEARGVARLSHTNLISGIDVGVDEGIHYLVMEYADGISLARLLKRGGALDEERALLIALQLARALAYAHKNDLVHGDVRPENVIITSDGVAKLSDLGMALQEESVSPDAERVGHERTADYLSPEQARGLTNVGPTADLYGLGATLFHMVTGRGPFVETTREAVLAKHLVDPAPSVRTIDPEISAPTDGIILRCLQKGPPERPGSAAELIQSLDGAVTALLAARGAAVGAVSTPKAAPEAPVVRRRRRRR